MDEAVLAAWSIDSPCRSCLESWSSATRPSAKTSRRSVIVAVVVNVRSATIITEDAMIPITIIVTRSSTRVNPASPLSRDVVALRALIASEVIGDHVVLVGIGLLVGGAAGRTRGVADERERAGRRDDPLIEAIPPEIGHAGRSGPRQRQGVGLSRGGRRRDVKHRRRAGGSGVQDDGIGHLGAIERARRIIEARVDRLRAIARREGPARGRSVRDERAPRGSVV